MDLMIFLLKNIYNFFEQTLSTEQGWRICSDLVCIAISIPFIADNRIFYNDNRMKFVGSSLIVIIVALFISRVVSIISWMLFNL